MDFALYWYFACYMLRDETQQQKKQTPKHVYVKFEQQKCRSACAFAQSDQRLCGSLPTDYILSFFEYTFVILAGL